MPPYSAPAAYFWGVPRMSPPGDSERFADLVDRFRGPIHLLCYRMTGSFDDAIRLSYDTFLTGWRLRDSTPADVHGWLVGLAVRMCIDHARRRGRHSGGRPADPHSCVPASDVPWLQPYPDRLLPGDASPATIGLPFLAATQSLAPRDRATLILVDVVGWSPARTAGALRMPNADVRPRLTRARDAVAAGAAATAETPESGLMDALLDGFATADIGRVDDVLHDDVVVTMPPLPFSFVGRDAAIGVLGHVFRAASDSLGRRRCVPTGANRQPAFAVYARRGSSSPLIGHELVVVRADAGRIVELTMFEPRLLPAFGLPTLL